MGTVNVKSTPKNVISPVSTTPKETIAKNAPKDTLEFRSMVANVKVNSTFSNIKKRKTRQNTRATSCNLTNFFSKLILKDFTDFYELFRYFCNEYQCNVILQGLHE